jgi:hypothetical protein
MFCHPLNSPENHITARRTPVFPRSVPGIRAGSSSPGSGQQAGSFSFKQYINYFSTVSKLYISRIYIDTAYIQDIYGLYTGYR